MANRMPTREWDQTCRTKYLQLVDTRLAETALVVYTCNLFRNKNRSEPELWGRCCSYIWPSEGIYRLAGAVAAVPVRRRLRERNRDKAQVTQSRLSPSTSPTSVFKCHRRRRREVSLAALDKERGPGTGQGHLEAREAGRKRLQKCRHPHRLELTNASDPVPFC